MTVNDELGKRLKENYENIPKTKLMRRCPVAIRIDGRAFHTYTKGFEKPFDNILIKTMQETMKYLCQHIQGCVFGYTQSDEITLILVDYKKLTSCAWFDYEVQKMCSISASMATKAFGKMFTKNVYEYCKGKISDSEFLNAMIYGDIPSGLDNLTQRYLRSLHNGAELDSRCFSIPKEEVANLVYWRQVDATRNSIQMVGQANFSHKELHKKTQNMIQDMLHEIGINWNDFPTDCKRGAACYRVEKFVENKNGKLTQFDFETGETKNGALRKEWVIDREMPIIKGYDRPYIENLVYYTEAN